MTKNFARILFTRSMIDDLSVVGSDSWVENPEAVERQFRAELSDCIDVSKLTIEELQWVTADDTYRYVTTLELGNINQNDPDAVLDHVVATLQRAYDDELAAGHFDIETITLGGVSFDVVEILAARHAAPGI